MEEVKHCPYQLAVCKELLGDMPVCIAFHSIMQTEKDEVTTLVHEHNNFSSAYWLCNPNIFMQTKVQFWQTGKYYVRGPRSDPVCINLCRQDRALSYTSAAQSAQQVQLSAT